MANEALIHIVKKSDISQHSCIPLNYDNGSVPELAEGCIRVRSALVSLSANNLSYAHGGTRLHWWDAYRPPAPIDASEYGIVPAWGYARIIESTMPELKEGSLMWGFWPSHDMPVVLELERDGDVRGHWIERSDGRRELMPLYNRCIEAAMAEQEEMAWQTVIAPVGGAGWALNRFCFGDPPIHPFGIYDWSTEDADLSQAVVISMSASGKTARVFNHGVVHERKAGTGPLGLLAVTANVDGNLIPKAAFPTKTVAYADCTAQSTLDWITSLNPKKIVLVDFGARGTSLSDLQHSLPTSIPLTIIGVGSEAKPMSPEELSVQAQKRSNMPNRIQMNASGIYEKAMQVLGKEAFFREKQEGLKRFFKRGGTEGSMLVWGEGTEGIEGGWRRLCKGEVGAGECLVFRMGGKE